MLSSSIASDVVEHVVLRKWNSRFSPASPELTQMEWMSGKEATESETKRLRQRLDDGYLEFSNVGRGGNLLDGVWASFGACGLKDSFLRDAATPGPETRDAGREDDGGGKRSVVLGLRD